MKTPYDWITMLVFASLVVLFLHRSDQASPPRDHLWQYLVAGAGCAFVNWLGNAGRHWQAIAVGACVALFIIVTLKPFRPPPEI